jgi:hypothetical protein
MVQADRSQMTTLRMRIAWWVTKATNTHSEYVILIDCPPQQWLHERAPLFRYTYIACLVVFKWFICFISLLHHDWMQLKT